MRKEFRQSIREAVSNKTLTGALGRFSEAYRASRARAYQGIDFEVLRARVAEVKGNAASRLDELAGKFAQAAAARGAQVVRLRTGEQVREYIGALAKEKGARLVVKSKSMASEEIHLNPYLEKLGIEVRETDLGEWIVQLAGQRPSHMVMPAIHMTKEQVARLFSKEVGERLDPDIPRLVKVAREELRQKFLMADMGISGANIAVAETGTLVILTNEGNARLVATLPKVHVVLVGIEKLVESVEDCLPILTALPRSATGQLLTSYVSMVTGATPNVDGTTKELHIVLMDNRRSAMAADPDFRQALQCIRCASCLNVCPVYRLVGGHVFGSVYTGGIGTILTAWFDELKKSEEIQALCIQCGSCKEVCPGQIDVPGLILEVRRRMTREKGLHLAEKAVFSVVNNRRAFHSVLRAASVVQGPFASGGFIRHLPMFLSKLTDGRSLPAIAAKPLRDTIAGIRQPRGSRERAVLYAGCLIDFAYPEMGEAVVRILNKAGIEVLFPDRQTCCGAPARYSGAFEVAGQNAADNVEALVENDAQYIVCACPTCTVALKQEFAATLQSVQRTDLLQKAQVVAARAVDFSTLMRALVDQGRLSFRDAVQVGTFTYHDSCHYKRTLRASENPREILRRAGGELVEMAEADMCCGMGGSYSVKMPEISVPMLERKMKNIEEAKVRVVVADCPGCVMQLRGGFEKAGREVMVCHTAELIEKALG